MRESPVDFDKQSWVVKGMLKVDIHGAGDVTELVGGLFPDEIISALVHAGDFHVDGRGVAEVQDLRHDVRRLQEKLHARETVREPFAQTTDICPGRRAPRALSLQSE